tara:strand:- start:374 stop:1024 length:651 start_codon:yes stop_codon:yes gene_type:complete
MHKIVQNLINIENKIKSSLNTEKLPKIIAVSKTFPIDKTIPLIEYGHIHFGENKVQEAIDKWTLTKQKHPNLKLHMIGKLQTNKVKFAVKLFDYIHSVDSEKLAKKISEEQKKISRKLKIFIQVNIGSENQKSGVNRTKLEQLINFSRGIGLDIVGVMCIPPLNDNPQIYFREMMKLKELNNLNDLSMGMTSDYIDACKYETTFIRIGSGIFGERS